MDIYQERVNIMYKGIKYYLDGVGYRQYSKRRCE